MSTDYSIGCTKCKVEWHLGQRMGGKYSFGWGSTDTEGAAWVMQQIWDHFLGCQGPLTVDDCESAIFDGFHYMEPPSHDAGTGEPT